MHQQKQGWRRLLASNVDVNNVGLKHSIKIIAKILQRKTCSLFARPQGYTQNSNWWERLDVNIHFNYLQHTMWQNITIKCHHLYATEINNLVASLSRKQWHKQIYAQSWQRCFNDILQDWSLVKQLLTKLDPLIFKWRVRITCSSGIHVEGQVLNLSLNSKLIKAPYNPTYHDLWANPAQWLDQNYANLFLVNERLD